MRYYLSSEQFYKLWDNYMSDFFGLSSIIAADKRARIFTERYPATNVKYYEELHIYDIDLPEGYWGVLEGDERNINWILLQL